MSVEKELIEKTEEYLQWDPVESTRIVVETIYKEKNYDELRKMMNHRLEFGTAGLRGKMGAGYNCMNDLVVLQTAQVGFDEKDHRKGICEYLLQQFGEEARERGVVVGFDHRAFGAISSKSFFLITAKVFNQKGIKVYGFNRFAFTPLVPFCVSKYHCCCGIMITASHNPAADNGYKIYWENACQIISPHDKGISECIRRNLQPWCDYRTIMEEVEDITEESCQAYMRDVSKQLHYNEDAVNANCPSIMYTAMHGVGYYYVKQLLAAFHLREVQIVECQNQPDPTFPTVSFPNPEEKGALTIAMQCADEAHVPYVMATDPDADRFICCEKVKNEWHVYKGDEIGALFGYSMCKRSTIEKKCMVNSVVSSKILRKIGDLFHAHVEQTLTGFKWMGNKQADLEKEGYCSMLTYEEAIGYAVGGVARDKDGVSAMCVMCEIISTLSQEKRTLMDLLEEIYQACGYYTTRNGYVISTDPVYTSSIFARLRKPQYKTHFGEFELSRVCDLTEGYDTKYPERNYEPLLPVDKNSGMIMQETAINGASFTIRSSGTEPKIKYYCEVTHRDKQECEKLADRMIQVIIGEIFQ